MTTNPRKEPGIAPVVELLASRGAAGISHPGGTLLAHLERVHALLGQWGARPVVQLDIAAVSPVFRAQAGEGLLRLFTSWRGLLHEIAWRSVQDALP